MLRDLIDWIRLESLARREIRLGIGHQFRKIRFVERFDACGQRGVAQDEYRCAVFARDSGRFDRDVEAIFHRRWREHDARAVAVAAEDSLVQIALLHVGGQAGARSAALNIANDDRDLGHRRPTDCFGFE